MAVIQPLYFPGGRYAASTDRKLLAALIASESDGTRVTGVIPSAYGTKSMKVTWSGSLLTLSIAPGMCVIPDMSVQTADSPGFYLAAIDASSESVTLAANSSGSSRTDSVFAVVDDTPYTITTKVLTANVATLTTSTAHGFVSGQTVVVTGVDNTFDGSYVISSSTPPTTYTFSYAKTADNVTSAAVNATATSAVGGVAVSKIVTNKVLSSSNLATLTATAHGFASGDIVTVKGVDSVFDGSYEIAAVTTDTFSYVKYARAVNTTAVASSSAAIARVPFAVKVETGSGTTLSGKKKIKLAQVVVANLATTVANTDITDYRQYAAVVGGVHLYNAESSGAAPAGVDGRLRWNVNATSGVRKLEVYDGQDSAWRAIYDTGGNNHDSVTTDSSASAIHHTLGTGTNQAASGAHLHAGIYATTGHTHPEGLVIGTTSTTAAAGDHTHPELTQTAWTSYTPTWTGSTTNPSLGNGTLSAAYIRIGNTVHFRINLTMGTTTTYGSGNWRFTLPVASNGALSGAGGVLGGGSIFDAAPATRYYAFIYHFGSGVISLANDSFPGGITQTLPITFAVNDAISMSGTYEAA